VHAYLSKPFASQVLLDAIGKSCGLTGRGATRARGFIRRLGSMRKPAARTLFSAPSTDARVDVQSKRALALFCMRLVWVSTDHEASGSNCWPRDYSKISPMPLASSFTRRAARRQKVGLKTWPELGEKSPGRKSRPKCNKRFCHSPVWVDTARIP